MNFGIKLKISLNVILLTFLIISCQQLEKNEYKPHGLMVEFIREPADSKINDSRPEYSWIVPNHIMYQKSYQIIVSSSEKLIDQNIGDVWDSKEVNSGSSINIEHGGKVLKPNTEYFWKIKVWGDGNKTSEYSDVQMFKTGDFTGTVSSKSNLQIERIAPIQFNKKSDGNYFADFGKDGFGTLELTYETEVADSLIIRLGEKIKDGKIDQDPDGTIRYLETKLEVLPDQSNYVLKLPPDKRNTNKFAVSLPDSIGVVMPFRYAEIDNVQSEITSNDIRQKAIFYYFKNDESSFKSSDSILNQVWDICKYSMKATSFTGLYIDGDRERIPYEADAYINQLSHYSVDREYSMAKQTIEYFMDNPTWPTEWLLHTALIMYQDYYYTGGTELIEAYYDKLKYKTLYELARADGLISTVNEKVNDDYMKKLGFNDFSKKLKDIVDWPPAQKDTGWKLATEEGERDGYEMMPVNTVVNCFFYQNMEIMKEFASLLDKKNDADYFQKMAERVKKSINEKLFDTERGVYIDGEGSSHASLHANMMPLAFDLVPEEHIKSVADFVKSRGMACSVYGAQYLLEGLYKAGEDEYALNLMRAKHDRSWYNMIKIGSTITLEAWDMKYKPNSDWNHAWGSAPANIISRYLWGIQPKVPGFSAASIYPQMGSLTECTIEVPTLIGTIKGTFQISSKNIKQYEIEIPANMEAEFKIDNPEKNIISLNDEEVKAVLGIINLKHGNNRIEIKNL